MKKIFLISAAFALVFTACKKDQNAGNPFPQSESNISLFQEKALKNIEEVFSIDAASGGTIETKNGNKIEIKELSFIDVLSQNIIDIGSVDVKVIEVTKMSDIMKSGIGANVGNLLLETGGFYSLRFGDGNIDIVQGSITYTISNNLVGDTMFVYGEQTNLLGSLALPATWSQNILPHNISNKDTLQFNWPSDSYNPNYETTRWVNVGKAYRTGYPFRENVVISHWGSHFDSISLTYWNDDISTLMMIKDSRVVIKPEITNDTNFVFNNVPRFDIYNVHSVYVNEEEGNSLYNSWFENQEVDTISNTIKFVFQPVIENTIDVILEEWTGEPVTAKSN